MVDAPHVSNLIDEEADELSEEDDDDEKSKSGRRDCLPAHNYSPLYLLSTWTENHTRRRRITLAILLPSGVTKGMFGVRIDDNSRSLELSINWPTPLINMKLLHAVFLKDEKKKYELYHPEVSGFEDDLKRLRSTNSEWVTTKTHIPLPFQVETNSMEKFNLGWADPPARVVYVRLQAPIEKYEHGNDQDDFVVIDSPAE